MTYTGTVSDTLIRIYNKYHHKNDISFATAACQAAKYLDEYFSHSDQRYRNDNSLFLYQIYHTFAEMIFYTLEIVEYDHYTNNTRDLEVRIPFSIQNYSPLPFNVEYSL